MSTFILVHGSWHAAWCWYKLMPRLEKSGHTVLAPDLPSLGRDRTPVNRVSLATWRRRVCEVVDSVPGQVVLVGHSRGGIVISEVAEHRPERVQSLVYLCAFLLRDGECLTDVAGSDETSLVPPNMVMSEDKTSSVIRDEVLRDAFYGECPDDDFALARLCLQPEPTLPLTTPLKLTDANFGRVPRVYVECLRDRAIPIALQRRMHGATPCQRVLVLDTDHSPFFSRPDELAALLATV
ncbi:MAG: alpha/beta fold hydrolase [Gammaproteobacteria bacterium]